MVGGVVVPPGGTVKLGKVKLSGGKSPNPVKLPTLGKLLELKLKVGKLASKLVKLVKLLSKFKGWTDAAGLDPLNFFSSSSIGSGGGRFTSDAFPRANEGNVRLTKANWPEFELKSGGGRLKVGAATFVGSDSGFWICVESMVKASGGEMVVG